MIYNRFFKQIYTVTLGISFAIFPLLTSCESEVVDLEPVDRLSDATAYTTPNRCELSMVGAYDAAQCGIYNDSYSRGYPFGAASIIQAEMRGEDMINTASFYQITYQNTYSVSTANNMYMWQASFEAINRYNTVLAGQTKATADGVLTESLGNQYKGECLFLRALTYHNLMIHFANPVNVGGNNNYGMPLYLTAINTPADIEEASKIGRSTVEATYAQILKDLDEAEALLPEAVAANSITRASKGAAIALKTRVYLHKRDWANVMKEAAKLAPAAPYASPIGDYKLEASPATPFTSYTSNSESIFSVENNADDNGSVNGAMSAMFSARDGGRSLVTISPTIYNSSYWLEDDKRRALLLYRASDDFYFCDKYQKLGATGSITREEFAPIIRYSEVLLNYSEAALRSGNKDLALELLNTVRDRSLADPTTQSYKATDFATTVDMLKAILWERRIEFQGEGKRWLDIHRLAADDLVPSAGIPAKIAYNTKTKNKGIFEVGKAIDASWFLASAKFIPYTDKRFLWPIPINDLLRNPTLAKQQNAGW